VEKGGKGTRRRVAKRRLRERRESGNGENVLGKRGRRRRR